LGIDWAILPGSGRGGRVREADVLGAAARPAPASGRASPSRLGGLPKRRRAIAERMLASQAENAPVTLHTRADVTALAAFRLRLKAAGTLPVPGYTDLLAKLVAEVLQRHPSLAGCWDLSGALVLPDAAGLHVGIAVDTEAGLLVPVVRDVGRRSLAEITTESRSLIEKARGGKLPSADMEGGVFTITNLGGFGIDEFTPIINAPQTAILGVGAIRREPVVVRDSGGGESIAIRDLMTLSLTFDHCRVDGGPAARFLDDLRRAIESPTGLG
jgi:pyruvate dehydrogenase E2 component (dihydrolipoamide acetyltransferase)